MKPLEVKIDNIATKLYGLSETKVYTADGIFSVDDLNKNTKIVAKINKNIDRDVLPVGYKRIALEQELPVIEIMGNLSQLFQIKVAVPCNIGSTTWWIDSDFYDYIKVLPKNNNNKLDMFLS